MPNKPKDVAEFFERVAVLETQMKNIMSFQKVQTGFLVAIALMAIKAILFK